MQYMNPCSLGIVRLDGRGTVPYIVIRGQIFKYNFKSGTLDGAKTNEVGLDNVLKDRTIINQPIVGNFDGNAAGLSRSCLRYRPETEKRSTSAAITTSRLTMTPAKQPVRINIQARARTPWMTPAAIPVKVCAAAAGV